MKVFRILGLFPLGVPKLVNTIAYKMRESDRLESILAFIWTFIVLVVFYKAFWPLDSMIKTAMVFLGVIMAITLGITIIIKSYYFVTNLFYDITKTGSSQFDDLYKKLIKKQWKGMAAGQKAEVSLQYFIAQEKKQSYANVKFYK